MRALISEAAGVKGRKSREVPGLRATMTIEW